MKKHLVFTFRVLRVNWRLFFLHQSLYPSSFKKKKNQSSPSSAWASLRPPIPPPLFLVFFIAYNCTVCNGHSSKAVNRDCAKTNWPAHTPISTDADPHTCICAPNCTHTLSTMQKHTYISTIRHAHTAALTERVISFTLLVVVYRSQFQVSAQSQGSQSTQKCVFV